MGRRATAVHSITRRLLAVSLAATLQVWGAHAFGDTAPKTYPNLPNGISQDLLPDWLRQHTDIAPAAVVSLAHGVIVVLQDKLTLAGPGRRVELSIDREALSDAAVGIIRGRSDATRLELDCDASQYWVLVEHIYSGNALTGSAQAVQTGVGAATAYPGANIPFVMRAGCDPAYSPPLSSGQVAAAGRPAPSAPAYSPPPYSPPQSRPAPPTRSAAKQLAASPPVRRPPVLRPREAMASQPASGGVLVHIIASGSEAGARGVLADVARQFPEAARKPTRVDATQANGQTLFRASIGGFASRSEASAFCARLHAAGRECWVR